MLATHALCLLGATSHVAKGLIDSFLRRGEGHLHLHTRRPQELRTFLMSLACPPGAAWTIHEGYDDFASGSYDAVVNCVGVGTHRELAGDFTKYFTVGEAYDNLALDYVATRRPDSIYISFSSGAVYGRAFASGPVGEASTNSLAVNRVAPEDYYSICRLYSEAKHRSHQHVNVVDLRLFSYFSRYADLSAGYFMSDVISCVRNGTVLVTDAEDIVRDYLHPEDLYSLVARCVARRTINAAVDARSRQPVTKFAVLDYFAREHGLEYRISTAGVGCGPTGSKKHYYSECDHVSAVDFSPSYSSLDAITQETTFLLRRAG